MRRTLLFSAFVTTPLLAAALISLSGCGSSSGDALSGVSNNPTPSTPVASRYAGTYRSTLALGTKTGAVAVTIGADNRATGTLTVTDSRGRQATAFSFASGVYAISGSVNPTTGIFTMSGSINGQPFTYSGTLPAPGNNYTGGSYTLTAGGQTYTGTFGSAPQPVATPSPTASASPAASPSPAPSATPNSSTFGQGGTVSLAFSNISGASIDASAITSATTIGGVRSAPYPGTDGITVSIGVAGSKRRSASVTVAKVGGSLAVGDTFQLSATQSGGALVSYAEVNGVSAASVQLYTASSGTVTIVALSATSVTLRVTNVGLGAPLGYPAAGTFTLNGDVTGTLQ